MRYRSIFSKTKEMRFTGNLDLRRSLERLMRRANIPLAYSQGFNPRPKITLASALPLGYTSEHEVMDFWLKENVQDKKIHEILLEYSPPGFIFHTVNQIESSVKKLQVAIQSAEYEIEMPIGNEGLQGSIDTLLSQETIMLSKTRKGKTKTYNLRALIVDIAYQSNLISMHLYSKEGFTGRPDIVLQQLGIDPFDVVVHRKKIHFLS
jgi:radical SAM-linked protein